MTTDTDSHAVDPRADAEAQAKLTKSVGEPLTREAHDTQVPLFKRWLKKGTGA